MLQVEHGRHQSREHPRQDRRQERRLRGVVHAGKEPRDEAVRGHGVEHPGEGEHCAEEGRGEAEERADGDDGPHEVPADGVEGVRQRGVGVLQVVRHHQSERGRNAEVGEEDEEQRGTDGDGDRPLRVLRLLTARGDRVEANVSVETGK